MLSLRREEAEKISTPTENISIEPLSFCAAFVRMTQLSCEGKKTEESKLNKPGVHLHCYVSQTDVDRLHLMTKPVITVCCESLQMSHWGELEHHLKEDKNNLRVKERREKVSYREVEKRRPSQGFFQSECIYWNISFEWFHFFLPIALTPRCSCILKAQRRKKPPTFYCSFQWLGWEGDTDTERQIALTGVKRE